MRDGSVGSSPGWYPDPGGEYDLRYHNGVDWTGDVSTDGRRHVAPLGRLSAVSDVSPASGSAPLVLAIIALCIAWIPFVSIVAAGIAVVAIIVGVRRRGDPRARNASNAAIVTGAAALALSVAGTWLGVLVLGEVQRYEDPGPYDVSDVACTESDAGTRAAGSIANRSDTSRSYTIEVTFDGEHTVSTEVDDVAPGSVMSFAVVEDLRFDDLRCAVDAVNGPLPFGLDVGL